jgi:hypothetical protein
MRAARKNSRGPGRPPLGERCHFVARLSPDVVVALDAAAAGAGISRNALLERLIRRGLRIRRASPA